MLNKIFKLIKEVGHMVMEYYNNKVLINITYKSDQSPVTEVDKIAHNIIKKKLSIISPDIPLLSEENVSDWNQNEDWNKYWLIDPLDGTKEFLKKRHEFTINIALIEKGKPILGIIYAPFFKVLYYTDCNKSWKEEKGHKQEIHVCNHIVTPLIALSYSHPDDNIHDYLQMLGTHRIIKMGSSLKFCLVAEGKIQCYPRFGKTKIWDTAAGDAIVTAAGGIVNTWNKKPLSYFPSPNFYNPGFFVASDIKYIMGFYNNKNVN
ncbi:MAG TPA: 3'(2'),5'-bisphosphate nucleotidase CysQ [Buchnera sp. (in: enterobacteria)]|nr:3'(2'),5'-bisphosphate nucleotidase CysQ [Buchnera sp. (in: enterobacteria)]